MITALFKDGIECTTLPRLWQWDYGQVLRIQGLELPMAVEIHFALTEAGGEAVTRIGITRDGVTDVVIPDSLLENGQTQDYYIYAWVYLTDDTSANTTRSIRIHVKARPKPEAFDRPEDTELFREAIDLMNGLVDRTEKIGYEAGEAKAAAEAAQAKSEAAALESQKAQEVAKRAEEEAEEYKNQAGQSAADAALSEMTAEGSEIRAEEYAANAEISAYAAHEDAQQTAADRIQTGVDAARTTLDRKAVASDREMVAKDKADVDTVAAQALVDIVGAKDTAISVVSDEGTGQIQAIRTEGATQVQAVQDAATEIIADREQISANKADIGVLTNRMDIMAPGIIVRVTGTGRTTVEDAADTPMVNLEIKGKDEQVVTTGAQMLDASKLVRTHNDVVFAVREDGSILVTGNTLQNAANSAVLGVSLSPGTYYISGSTPIGDSKIFVRIKLWHGDSSTVVSDASFLVDGTETKIECFLQLYQGLSEFSAVVYPMINVGTTAKPWESYTGGTPSPSPDYPQKIVGSDVTAVTVTGAQLLPPDNIFPGFLTNANGTRTNDNNYRTIWLNLPAGTYTIAIDGGGMIVKTVIDGVFSNNSTSIADGAGYTCTLIRDGYLGISFRKQDSSDYAVDPKVILNAGNMFKPWQPYQSKTASITLTAPLHGIGDYRDEIIMTKRIDQCVELVFDGSESWAAISTYNGFYRAGILPFSAMRRAGLCNQFPVDTKGEEIESVRIGNGNSVLFCVYSRFYDDIAVDKGLSAWKAHLAAHPLKVVTYLDTPVETDLDATTVAALAELTTYKGYTTVSAAAGGPEPDITLEYVADTKTYIANEHARMQAAFDEQIAGILALLPAETQAAMINNETSALLAESEA